MRRHRHFYSLFGITYADKTVYNEPYNAHIITSFRGAGWHTTIGYEMVEHTGVSSYLGPSRPIQRDKYHYEHELLQCSCGRSVRHMRILTVQSIDKFE